MKLSHCTLFALLVTLFLPSAYAQNDSVNLLGISPDASQGVSDRQETPYTMTPTIKHGPQLYTTKPFTFTGLKPGFWYAVETSGLIKRGDNGAGGKNYMAYFSDGAHSWEARNIHDANKISSSQGVTTNWGALNGKKWGYNTRHRYTTSFKRYEKGQKITVRLNSKPSADNQGAIDVWLTILRPDANPGDYKWDPANGWIYPPDYVAQ